MTRGRPPDAAAPHRRRLPAAPAAAAALLVLQACTSSPRAPILTFSGSSVGLEADLLRRQLDRFEAAHPPLRVEVRATPDAADDRHQLYVQWLNARVDDPDVLQLDVIWTPEFAAAGWIRSLDDHHPPLDRFFPATIAANRWRGSIYALPWFVDVGMLYWRTDLMDAAPADLPSLVEVAAAAVRAGTVRYGLVWQGARYEGLVTVFLEYLTGFGGRILDEHGAVRVDEEPAVRALTFMRDAIHDTRIVPTAALTWQEEQVRFAFQNGEAAFMRNWPYAYPLLEEAAQSRVAGRFAVAPMPGAPGGTAAAALGGSQLAINAHTDQPDAAYELVAYLTEPAQMLERAAVVGQFPTRPALYDEAALRDALRIDPHVARRIIERAVPRPVTPVYAQLSEILQVHLHRALTDQQEPRAALEEAAAAMREVLERSGLTEGG